MNRLSLIRYTSAVALGLSTLWSAAVCAAEDAGAFDKIQQIRAGDLNIGYVDIGPRDGQPVILLHGWPYDIQSYAQVAPARPVSSPPARRVTVSRRRWRPILSI